MKSIFIDCNKQLAPVFAAVARSDDPPIVIHGEAFSAPDLPRLLAGYSICLDDHSYMPTEAMRECPSLRHIVFLGTGASSYMDVAALANLGIKVHTIKGYGDTAVAEHTIALMWAAARGLAIMDGGMRRGEWIRTEGMELTGKTLGLLGFGGIAMMVSCRAHVPSHETPAFSPLPAHSGRSRLSMRPLPLLQPSLLQRWRAVPWRPAPRPNRP